VIADTGEEVVKARCSLCHEGGAGGAPRIGNRFRMGAARGARKLALYETAFKGKPNTAMMARGGFRICPTTRSWRRWITWSPEPGSRPGLQPEAPPRPAAAAAIAAALAADADDKTITAYIAEALRAQLAPEGSKVEILEGVANVSGLE